MSAKPPAAKPDSHAAPAGRAGLSSASLRLGIGATLVVLMIGAVGWYLTRPKSLVPADELRAALQHIEQGRGEEAHDIARKLEELKYEDPEFPAGVPYVLGMAAFQKAEAGGEEAQQNYVVATAFLKEAGLRSLGDEYHAPWSFACGCSLFQSGELAMARPLLESALQLKTKQASRAGEMLAQIYLNPSIRTPELLATGLAYNTLALNDASKPEDRARLRRQQAELLLAQKQFDKATEVVGQVDDQLEAEPFAQIVRAQIELAKEHYAEATRILEPIGQDGRDDRSSVAQALLLLGMTAHQEATALSATKTDAADQYGKIQDLRQRAISWYRRTLDRFEKSPEALAANVFQAELLLQEGSHEKALACYGAALRTAAPAGKFANPWISQEDFRVRILAAWDAWQDQKRHSDAIALTELMTPLVPQSQALELAARANEHWAEQLEAGLAGQTETVRASELPGLRLRRRLTGEAYAKLAGLNAADGNNSEDLWQSAEQFRMGGDFVNALKQLDLFVAASPGSLLATARVRRAEILMDLDRLDDALKELNDVVATFPTDPAAFHAEYLMGLARQERNELSQADAAWRKVLGSNTLTPNASEWQKSLLALGRLQYERGSLERREAEGAVLAADPAAVEARWKSADLRWSEAIQLLEMYLARYGQGSAAYEPRFYLARALQQHADWLQRRMERVETETARRQLDVNMQSTRGRALTELQTLLTALQEARQQDRLDTQSQALLFNTLFEVPHTLFALRRYEEAIAAYNEAGNSAPQDAQLLTAYLQMARCYSRLDKPVEARSLLEQARVILNQKQIPEAAFGAPNTSLSRAEWEEWLARAVQVQP